MRLIDADAFDRDLCNHKFTAALNEAYDAGTAFKDREMYYSTQSFRDVMKYRPTIDAVPVTRCRDCVSSEYVIESNALPYYRCPYVNFDIYPDFYCAYGRERIADGRDHSPAGQD